MREDINFSPGLSHKVQYENYSVGFFNVRLTEIPLSFTDNNSLHAIKINVLFIICSSQVWSSTPGLKNWRQQYP